jgi:hypothetical protein
MSARKDDTGKPPISLIPRSALLAEARVMASGAKRYGPNNWREGEGLAWSRLIDAALRHITAFADGEDYDDGEDGSKELHLANARCCLAFLIEYYEKNLGKDDRYKRPVSASATERYFEIVAEGSYTKVPFIIERHQFYETALKRVEAIRTEWPGYTLTVQEAEYDDQHSQSA